MAGYDDRCSRYGDASSSSRSSHKSSRYSKHDSAPYTHSQDHEPTRRRSRSPPHHPDSRSYASSSSRAPMHGDRGDQLGYHRTDATDRNRASYRHKGHEYLDSPHNDPRSRDGHRDANSQRSSQRSSRRRWDEGAPPPSYPSSDPLLGRSQPQGLSAPPGPGYGPPPALGPPPAAPPARPPVFPNSLSTNGAPEGLSAPSSSRHSLPSRPSASSSINGVSDTVNASTATPASSTAALTPEEQAKQAKRARLEAWRREQAAKKALEEAKQRAQSIAQAVAPSATPVTADKDKTTTINAKGLRGLSLRPDFQKAKAQSASMMEDALDQPIKKQINRFDDLPPLDPAIPQNRTLLSENVDSGPALDDDGLLNDDDDEQRGGTAAAAAVLKARALQDQMDVDDNNHSGVHTGTGRQLSSRASHQDDDEEEEDPLDAFMTGVKSQVARVNEQDRKRGIANKPSGSHAIILGQDMDDDDKATKGDGGDDDEVDEIDELDRIGVATEDLLAIAAKKVKKKEMPTVDHSTVEYEPFRKVFYHPPAEIQDMSDELADQIRLEMDAIVVRGKECPKPLTKWSHCGLPASCLDVIQRLGYAAPTPIQSQAIPAIMSGRDIIGVAKTGSGKTMAFLLPMFRHIKDQRSVETGEGPVGIIMTPTRELAVQIYREMRLFIRALGLRAACVYGGAPISEQIAEMKKTADIVVATPGRLIDLLTANSGRVTNLRRVTYLVLDEADRMFDMGFEPQVMKIVNNIRPDRQTVLFSATFPKQMESLARKVLKNKPLEITVGGRSVVAAEIDQIVEVRPEASKFNRLLEILGDMYNREKDARTLIFVERQEAADDLLRELIRKGYVTMSLHGGKDQVDRDETISDFKAGNVPIVTATSVAARGLDVKQLKLVINYDVPNHMEDYVHRAGRTGRAGQRGTCITFITPEQDRYARDIIAALKASKARVPPELEAMATAFKEKLAAGKAKAAGSGFGGKGLERLETDREKALKAQKSAYGESNEEGAKDDGGDGKTNVQGQDKPASDEQLSKVQSMKIEIVSGAAPEAVRENKTVAATAPVRAGNEDETKATAVRAKAEQEQEAREAAQLKAQEAALEAAKAHGADTTKLAAVLENIRRQANARREAARAQNESERPRERRARDPDATDYHAIVPINDFPQRARWRVTNKETMSHLIESTGASITNKGVFYKEGTEPQPGEPPKLQLLIESNTKSMVEDAVREIQRLLVEATQAALEAEARNPGTTGRYSVV